MKLSVRYQIALLVFFVLAIYYPALFAEINSVDDQRMITSLLNTNTFSFKGLFFPGAGYYYRPLLMLTFIFDKYVWGLHESFMHLENILLQVINAILVFGIAWNVRKKWFKDAPIGLPFIAAVLFAVHPIATESVNWISGRTDLLSGTFLFFALYLLFCGVSRSSIFIMIAAGFSFLLACLSKDSAIAAFPAFMILTFRVMKGSDYSRVRVAANLSFTGSALSYFTLRRLATSAGDTGIGGVAHAVVAGDWDLINEIRIVLKVFGFYVKKLFLPWPLNFAIVNVSNWYVVVGVMALIICIIFLFRNGIISGLYLLAASTVVPALLVPLGQLTWTPIAERYIYMSTAPFCIAASFMVYNIWKRYDHSRLILWGSVSLIFLFTYATVKRTLIWQTNLSLYQDAIRKSPGFPPLVNELALALEKSGKREEANRLYQSNIMPNSAKYSIVTDMNRARAFLSQGKPAEARDILIAKAYGKDKPLYTDYLELLITIDEKMLLQPELNKRAFFQQEVRDALLSLAEVSGDPLNYYRLAKKLLALGMRDKAANYFELAYEKAPDNAYYKDASKRLVEKCREKK